MPLFLSLVIGVLLIASVHMAAPDHWLPITLVSERHSYTRARMLMATAGIGTLHAATSIALSAAALFTTKVLFPLSTGSITDASSVIMFAIGGYIILMTWRSKGEESIPKGFYGVLAVSIFPDITFLPILLSAIALAGWQQILISAEFFIVTVLSLLLVVAVISPFFKKGMRKIPEKGMDYAVGLMIVVLGVAILLI